MRCLPAAVLLLIVGLASSQDDYEESDGDVFNESRDNNDDAIGPFGKIVPYLGHHKIKQVHLLSKKTRHTNLGYSDATVEDSPIMRNSRHKSRAADDLEFDYSRPLELSSKDQKFIFKQLAKQEKLPQVAELIMGKKESTDYKDLYVIGYIASLPTKNLCKAWVSVYYDEDRNVIYSKTKFGCL